MSDKSPQFALASFNQHKVAEIGQILGLSTDYFVDLEAFDIAELPDEDAATFVENALIKARYVCQATGLSTLADDSGLCVDAMDGAPGVLSARFGLYDLSGQKSHSIAETDYAQINQKLVKMLQKYADKTKMDSAGRYIAHYTCAAVLVKPDGTEQVSVGRCEGAIVSSADAIRGTNGFGYDPCFVPKLSSLKNNKTMAELTAEEKNAISHRKIAFEGLKQWL